MIGEDNIFLVEGNSYDMHHLDGKLYMITASVEATVVGLIQSVEILLVMFWSVTISSGITVQYHYSSKG